MVVLANNTLHERINRFVNKHYSTEDYSSDFETRREFPRFPMADTVDVMIDSTHTPAEVVMATGRDISTGGLGFYSHRPIPAGTEMVLSIDNGQDRLLTRGVAVHNTLSVGLFKVGVRFII
ncbi:MAG: PilZ domain-containing protein [Phycisphaerae bacterium]|jgi:hypothetical protein|nr:PilZ domain-containing protein [Phycisphaerae bacterium]